MTKKENLEKEKIEIQKIINKFHSAKNVTKETRAFWKWLYNHNREAWIILDPIVSVQSDATFFEAFSKVMTTEQVSFHNSLKTALKPSQLVYSNMVLSHLSSHQLYNYLNLDYWKIKYG